VLRDPAHAQGHSQPEAGEGADRRPTTATGAPCATTLTTRNTDTDTVIAGVVSPRRAKAFGGA
jgi:hypothetical protein